MSARGEEALVEDRDLEHGDLQATYEPLNPIGDLAVLEDPIEQQRHDIEGSNVDLAHARSNACVLEPVQYVGRRGFGCVSRQRPCPARLAEIAALDARERAKQGRALQQYPRGPLYLAGRGK